MSVKILCAGCSKDEREQAESQVREALTRTGHGSPAWTVSLVKVGGRWSVRLDDRTGGGKGLTFAAPVGRLTDSLVEAIETGRSGGGPAGAATASAPLPPASEDATRLECGRCQKAFKVLFEKRAGEPEEDAPVSCPHCWFVNTARLPAEAAFANDYRTEKL
jgi:hypothetical protein